ncbi:NAD(P)-binding domain protein [Metarhizium album ARSEF 1941]|uniref:Hydroxynaphthalene reductase-like protein Arp2 n=1 Tax=Metarhizium album (strain ARSEF 1941) TaxID=1081103 RepID=A0A0B2X761_METAS|nr:NAD(P)-binding domain protein [Metarhizium album ARSEF 1941]KHO01305.1 NAD(P)-binding domain protein [Metarhizium album ARSEF 1941]
MALHGKVVLITGAGGGLGQQLARTYLDAGASIIISDVNEARLASARREFAAPHPDKVLVVEADVADEPSVSRLVAAAVREFSRLDVVVNNAAVMDRFEPATACSKATWDAVLAVNLTGPFLVTKHAVAQMERQQPPGGLVVNVGSNASFKGLSGGVAYVASKHGLVGLTRNTASSYGDRGIYAVALLLGYMEETNIRDAFAGGLHDGGLGRMHQTQPDMRPVPTDHVARYALFLSDKDTARSANGSCIVINGNWPEA